MHCGSILVIEDDPEMLRLVKDFLEASQFKVYSAESGQAGLDILEQTKLDVLVLDLNLPDTDGLTICREVRKISRLPILMLSSQAEDIDRVIGLEVGADDYMAKPFHPRELIARVRALMRRSQGFESEKPASKSLQSGAIRVDLLAHTSSIGDTPLHLTPIEFGLLKAFVTHVGQVLTRQALLDLVWGDDYVGDERIVDVHIRNLRTKIKAQEETEHITSVRGVGYKWVE